MSTKELTQEEHFALVERVADELADLLDKVAKKQAELYGVVHAAFPENRGGKQQRGVLTEVARRSRWTREYVAKIRDGEKSGGQASG